MHSAGQMILTKITMAGAFLWSVAHAAETEVADRPRQPVNYAGRVAERTADNVRKPSVLAQLHAKQAERSAEPQKSQKRKSHDMEL